MGFLDFLSSGLTTATQAAGAEQQGELAARATGQKSLLERIAMMRQQQQDADRKRLEDAQIGHLNAQTTKLGEVAPETFGDFENLTQDGKPSVVQRGNRGTVRPVEGAAPYVAPQQPLQVNPETERHNREMERLLAARQGQEKPLPAPVAKQLADYDANVTLVDDSIAAVKANPNAFGLKNYLPQALVNRMPTQGGAGGVPSRAALEALVGELRHSRFGGALTPLEAAKSARIFSEPTSDSETVLNQLNAVKHWLTVRRGAYRQQVMKGVTRDLQDIQLPYEP